MTAQDLLLKRAVSWAELRAALAIALGIAEYDICIVKDIQDDMLPTPILAVVSAASGEFQTQLNLHLHPTPEPSTKEALSRLAELLENPMVMLLHA